MPGGNRAQFAGRVSDEDFARMAGRHRDAARNEAAKLQIAVFERMGARLELESEGENTTKKRNDRHKPPKRV